MPRQKNSRTQSPSFFKAVLTAMLIGTASALPRKSIAPENKASACENYFRNTTYDCNSPVHTVLIGGPHKEYEPHIADCLASIAVEGDHLLVEYPNIGREIACDHRGTISSYAQFNGKLKCYGWDLNPMDSDEEAKLLRERDFQTNKIYLLKKVIPKLLDPSMSGKQCRETLKDHAERLIRESNLHALPEHKITQKRVGKYLEKLANKVAGLTHDEIFQFINSEVTRANKRTEEIRSFLVVPRDEALVKEMKAHQQQLVGSTHRLFGIGGANHMNLQRNTNLKEAIEAGDNCVTILQPTSYALPEYGQVKIDAEKFIDMHY